MSTFKCLYEYLKEILLYFYIFVYFFIILFFVYKETLYYTETLYYPLQYETRTKTHGINSAPCTIQALPCSAPFRSAARDHSDGNCCDKDQ